MNKNGYQIVNEVLKEGFKTFYTKTMPHAAGKAVGKIAKVFGGTSEKLAAAKKEIAKSKPGNVSWKASTPFEKGMEVGIKPRSLTKS